MIFLYEISYYDSIKYLHLDSFGSESQLHYYIIISSNGLSTFSNSFGSVNIYQTSIH